MHLCAAMISTPVKLFLAFCVFDLYNTPLEDVRSITLDESVDHPGAADQTNLPNGERQERMLFRTVQRAFCMQQLCKAV